MSQIQRVIILNRPFKIRGFTVLQWILLAVSLALAFILGAQVPHDWKIGNLPTGFLVGLTILCAAMVGVNALQMKPIAWWKNVVLYKLGIVNRLHLPHFEESQIYPDPTIVEPKKREEHPYIRVEG